MNYFENQDPASFIMGKNLVWTGLKQKSLKTVWPLSGNLVYDCSFKYKRAVDRLKKRLKYSVSVLA